MVVFGKDTNTGKELIVSLDDLHSGTTITGVQGTGKTSVAVNIGLQEMQAGASVICLDPTTGADMIRDIISRMPEERVKKSYYLTIKEDKKLYSKHPFLLNIFGYNNPGSVGIVEQARARNQIFLAFEKLFPATGGVFFQEILRNLIPLLLDHPTFTIFDIEDFLLVEDVREQILKDIDNFRVVRYWNRFSSWSNSERNKLTGPFLRRLGELLDDPFISYHIGQKRGLLDIRKAILNGENLFIHLPIDDMPYKIAAPAIGTLVMMQIYAATFSFGDLPRNQRPNFCLIVDEFTKWVYDSGDEFKDLFAFGRKYGISQVLCMQYTGQLDEENLRSIRDGITSAKLMISLRSTLADGPRLAPLYRGVKRKPTDIYIDVLDRLEKHPSTIIKEFYWHTVKPLQEAAKIRERDKQTVQYDFGYGTTSYSPAQAQAVEDELNLLLYYTQKEQKITVSALEHFVTAYAELSHLVYEQEFDDPQVIDMIKEVEAGLKEITELIKGVSDEMEEEIEDWKKKGHTNISDIFSPEWHRLNTVRAQMKVGYDKIVSKDLDALYKLKRKKIRIENPNLPRIRATLETVLNELIASPLAEDKDAFSESEIAMHLQQLPNRQGYAKLASEVYVMTTVNLPEPVISDARWNTIIKQTKDRYCRGRTEIKNEIEALFRHDKLQEQPSSLPVQSPEPVNKPSDGIQRQRYDFIEE